MELMKLLGKKHLLSDSKIKDITELVTGKGMTTVEAVYSLKILSDELLGLISEAYNTPIYSLEDIDVNFEIMETLSMQKFINSRALIVSEKEPFIAIVSDPGNISTMTWLRDDVGCKKFYVISKQKMSDVIMNTVRPALTKTVSETISDVNVSEVTITKLNAGGVKGVTGLLDSLLVSAIEQRASDIQIIPHIGNANVYFRVDGIRKLYTQVQLTSLPPLFRKLAELCSQSSIKEDIPMEGKATFTLDSRVVDARVNVIPTRLGYSINLRLFIDEAIDYKDLGASDGVLALFESIKKMSKGLVLFVGPTGSGKTTSVHALLKILLQKEINICSAEDPVERIIEGINQVDISNKKLTYADTSKSFMRHDPDVIFIGEIRDLNVADNVVKMSDTGHLVISTLHTSDAVSTISRLINMGVDADTLSEALSVIISQRLVRRLCPHCKELVELSKTSEHRELFKLGDANISTYIAKGCHECDGIGYLGRMCVNEWVIIDSDIRVTIENKSNSDSLRQIIYNKGYGTLLEDAVKKVLLGHTSFEEVLPIKFDENIREGKI